MTETSTSEPQEITDERIYEDLKQYQDFGMIEYVLPTEPLGEQWIIGWNSQILKFTSREGIVGFLAGIQVCATFVGQRRAWPPSWPGSRLAGDQS